MIILLLFIVLFKQGVFENNTLKMVRYWDQQGRIRAADTLKRGVKGTKVNDDTDSDSAVKLEEEKLSEGNLKNMYYIIIGSFSNSDNAEMVAKQYRGQGYNTTIISTNDHNGNKTKLVSVKAFSSHGEAVGFLRELQRKVAAKAWIYSGTNDSI